MKLDPYENKDSYRITLSTEERAKVDKQLKRNDSGQSIRLAWFIASCCGLRRQEVQHVRYKDLIQRDTGDHILRVREDGAKGDKYRETPIPQRVAVIIETVEETTDVEPEDRVVDVSMRTVQRHLDTAAQLLEEETGDEGWSHLTLHDGRRTWANALLDDDVSPLQCMAWGGWDDWRTFRDHYLQDFSEAHQSEEMAKVDWL